MENADKIIKALEKNNMEAYFFQDCESATKKILQMLTKEEKITFGGSVTLMESGLYKKLKENGYNLSDRYEKGLSREELKEIYSETFSSDCFITSSNAITEDGFLYNVDGNGNRVAALTFGPEKVFVIAGVNKIVKNIDEAVERVRKTAAPKNTKRLSCETYCKESGICVAEGKPLGYGCESDDRICAHFVITGRQRRKRIYVFLINSELGF